MKNGGNLASIHNIKEARLVGELSGNRDGAWIGGGGSSEVTYCSLSDVMYSRWWVVVYRLLQCLLKISD